MQMIKKYVTPNVSVIVVAMSDVITTSLGGGYDDKENWQNDVFIGKNP